MSGGSSRSVERKRPKTRLTVVGFDLGDLEAVADGRVGRRAAPLAEDFALVAGVADDVVDGEEVGRVALVGDELELADQSAALDRRRERRCG